MARALAVALAAFAAALSACGGSSNSGGIGGVVNAITATGTIPLTATQFASLTQSTTCRQSGVNYGFAFAAVGASDVPGTCAYLQNKQNKQNAKSISLAVVRLNLTGTSASVDAGVYRVGASGTAERQAFVFVSRNDAACNPTDVEATDGNVTIVTATGERVVGAVDVTLSDGGKVTGSFDAPACALTLSGDVCAGQFVPETTSCVP